jgi:hypothetical protein
MTLEEQNDEKYIWCASARNDVVTLERTTIATKRWNA